MQCKPVTALPAGEKWTFEIKFDGYRCVAVKRGREIALFSRAARAVVFARETFISPRLLRFDDC
jgi:ATP-dependent DNA ligase